MTVDVSDPSHVVFSSTQANPENLVIETSTALGVSLVNFFTSYLEVEVSFPVSGDLFPNGATVSFDAFSTLEGEFNLYNWANTSYIDFLTDSPAFTGEGLVFDLSSWAAYLPTSGHTGTIHVGYDETGLLLGSYQVIPEPTSVALMVGVGLIGFGLHLRRRSA